jgi:hypothetical protein
VGIDVRVMSALEENGEVVRRFRTGKWAGMTRLAMKNLLAKISCGARYLRRYVPEGLAGGNGVFVWRWILMHDA